TEEQAVPIAVDACYPYGTMATTGVCVAKTSKVCEPVAEKVVQSSGAPIQVTEFKQIAQPVGDTNTIQLRFTITVENQGDGEVFSISNTCPQPINPGEVSIKEIKLGSKTYGPEFCKESIITLSEGEGSVSCTIPVEVSGEYEEELTVYLSYIYKQRLTTEISVMPS
ncbi:MAG: hypothetical protein QXH80_04525, partial [Candidatus Nanoarchaeia archaeon]